MVEKRYICRSCCFIPRTKEEESSICPECGCQCVRIDVIETEADYQAYLKEAKQRKIQTRYAGLQDYTKDQ